MHAFGVIDETRLLLREDEIDYRQEIANFFRSEGYQVIAAGSATEFMHSMDAMDIASIDVSLSDADAFEVPSMLRAD
ncbi:response regulator transcription factor [Herminiimonas arsenitoxidans]|uniref:hypothetical protein n=1 Tax=Herminiimonas arsenitoxidans TaxID=1809410 RepID=UPI0012FFAD02|nr:hypothetical protein [Herminiimonas arsenitoxidans]